MGRVFRPKYRKKDGTVQESLVWWIQYYRDGRPHRESSGSEKVGVARDLLKEREGDSVKGIPITPKMGRILFSEMADAVLADYKMNKRNLSMIRSAESRSICCRSSVIRELPRSARTIF